MKKVYYVCIRNGRTNNDTKGNISSNIHYVLCSIWKDFSNPLIGKQLGIFLLFSIIINTVFRSSVKIVLRDTRIRTDLHDVVRY